MAGQSRMAPRNEEPRPVVGNTIEIAATVTRPSNTTAYAAKDTVADETSGATIINFPNAAMEANRGGYITGATIMTDQVANTAQFKLHLFHTTPTVLSDNVAMTAPLFADRAKYIGSITFPAVASEDASAGAAFAQATTTAEPQFPIPFVSATADSDIYAMLETIDSFTPASAQIFYIVLRVEQN
jgi:hypothetical protein